MKIYAQMDPKSHPKIDLWAIRGSIFEVLGGFVRTLLFDEFWDVRKSTKNDKSSTFERPWALYPATFGRVGGRGGGPGNLVLLVLGQILAELFDTPSTTV